jgi:chorismate mutase
VETILVRGIRGAVTVSENSAEQIKKATRQLRTALQEKNQFLIEDIASAIFTVTSDLNAVFPAAAAREMGWSHVPLMCSPEIAVPQGIPRCVRVLLHVNTMKTQQEIRHIYLGEAVKLRPDLVR